MDILQRGTGILRDQLSAQIVGGGDSEDQFSLNLSLKRREDGIYFTAAGLTYAAQTIRMNILSVAES
jgi:hypothetical protein